MEVALFASKAKINVFKKRDKGPKKSFLTFTLCFWMCQSQATIQISNPKKICSKIRVIDKAPLMKNEKKMNFFIFLCVKFGTPKNIDFM